MSGSSHSLSLSGHVDEIRFYPFNAQMTTFTFDPLVGMTSQCDVNNTVGYYQYDSFNRLKAVRDQEGNLVKALDYQLQKPFNQ